MIAHAAGNESEVAPIMLKHEARRRVMRDPSGAAAWALTDAGIAALRGSLSRNAQVALGFADRPGQNELEVMPEHIVLMIRGV